MMYKYAAYFPMTGVIFESDNLRTVYHAAESERRWNRFSGYGVRGYTLTREGEVIHAVKDGEDVTLKEAEVSVRLYNVTMRKLLMDGKLNKDQRDIKLGDLRKLVEDGAMKNARNAGTKTYTELLEVLREYTGWGAALQMAIEDCLMDTPSGKKWIQEHFR